MEDGPSRFGEVDKSDVCLCDADLQSLGDVNDELLDNDQIFDAVDYEYDVTTTVGGNCDWQRKRLNRGNRVFAMTLVMLYCGVFAQELGSH